jgi:hypothetical protein
MAGVDAHSTGRYSMWQHESGLNDVSGDPQVTRAIRSYYQTNEFNVVLPQQIGGSGTDQGMSYSILEPDFDQVGDLSFTAVSRSNARAKERRTGPITIKAVPTAPDEQLIKFKHSGRFTSFIVESNVENGDYITGAPLIHWQPGDARRED